MTVIKVIKFCLLMMKATLKERLQLLRFYLKTGISPTIGLNVPSLENVTIGPGSSFGNYTQIICQDAHNGSEIRIGSGVITNSGVIINADNGGKIHIGDDVLVGPNVIFRAANHSTEKVDVKIKSQGHKPGTIVIGNNVWLGANAVILPNVTIGEGSIIGAGSIVNKDIPSFCLAAGVPAKVLRLRTDTRGNYV